MNTLRRLLRTATQHLLVPERLRRTRSRVSQSTLRQHAPCRWSELWSIADPVLSGHVGGPVVALSKCQSTRQPCPLRWR